MPRSASMTVLEAELAVAELNAGSTRPVYFGNSRNQEWKGQVRAVVRKWLAAKGIPSAVAGVLTYTEMEIAYNDNTVDKILKKIEQGKEDLGGEDEPAPQPAPTPAPVPDIPFPETSERQALQILRDLLGGGAVNREQVTKIVQEQIANVTFPRDVVVRINDQPPVKLDGQHPVFERVVNYVVREGNVMLVGPAGCGKTHLAGQVAKALGRDYGFISGTAGVSESHLTGWLLPVDGGRFEYTPAQFVELYERGNALWCFDEMDAFDSNMLMVGNTATSNGHLCIPHRRGNPIVTRGANVGFIATCNTFGTGADPLYVSRNQLDGATLDRWMVIHMDYDRAFEEKLAASRGLSVSELTDIWTLRDKASEAKLRRVVSTRAIQKAAISKESGETWNETMAMLTCGWTKDEKAKVGR